MILTAQECREILARLPHKIAACYILWDRERGVPVYVGTAWSPSRIRGHLKKDDVREGNVGTLFRNPPFYEFVMRQPIGWLGVSFELYSSEAEARQAEVKLIAEYGMLPSGTLFNRRSQG